MHPCPQVRSRECPLTEVQRITCGRKSYNEDQAALAPAVLRKSLHPAGCRAQRSKVRYTRRLGNLSSEPRTRLEPCVRSIPHAGHSRPQAVIDGGNSLPKYINEPSDSIRPMSSPCGASTSSPSCKVWPPQPMRLSANNLKAQATRRCRGFAFREGPGEKHLGKSRLKEPFMEVLEQSGESKL